MTIAGSVAFSFIYFVVTARPYDLNEYLLLGVVAGVVFLLINELNGLYQREFRDPAPQQAGDLVVSWVSGWCLLASIAFMLKAGHTISRGAVFSLAFAGLPVVLISRIYLARARRALGNEELLERIGVLRLGAAAHIGSGLGERFRIACARQVETRDQNRLLEEVADFVTAAARTEVSRAFVLTAGMRPEELRPLMPILRRLPISVSVISDSWNSAVYARPVSFGSDLTAFEIQPRLPGTFGLAAKRALDITVALFAIVLLAPLLLAVAFAVRRDSEGAIIFRQDRRGLNGERFQIFKFRTMRVMENGAEIRQVIKDDDRITKVGHFLRATSLDELPQLFNVLRGEMSLVGPRPHAIAHDEFYTPLIPAYGNRAHVKPGITGWAQVNGFRGATPKLEQMAARIRHDVWYVNNWSIGLDLVILLRTAYALIAHKGA